MRVRSVLALGLLGFAVSAFGCDDGYGSFSTYSPPWIPDYRVIGPAAGVVADPSGGASVAVSVTGHITFDRLAPGPNGLDTAPAVQPCAFVKVEAVSTTNFANVLDKTVTDAAGSYVLNFFTERDYFVRARAESGTGVEVDRVYHPLTFGTVVHAVCSQIQHRVASPATVDLHADYQDDLSRAGAFAILDTVRVLRAAVAAQFPALGELDIYWCLDNQGGNDYAPERFIAGSQTVISGPHHRPTIFLLGGWKGNHGLSDDHDEFDETVIGHEWASFVQLTQSRNNNFGGLHAGEELIPTASYSEGVVTAIGCALLGQRVYRDTAGYFGDTTGVQFELDCESGIVPGSGVGYGNEFENTRAVYDLLDGAPGGPPDFDGDGVGVTYTDFFASFAALKTRTAPYEVCWLASLLQQLIDDGFLTALEANLLMQGHGAQFPSAGGPDPFPSVLAVGGGTQTGTLKAGAGTNANFILGPGANAVFRMTLATPATVRIDLAASAPAAYTEAANRLDLSVHDLERDILGLVADKFQDKTLTVNFPAGTYIVRVQHRPVNAAVAQNTGYSITAQ